jgi:DNA-directed RNA polymerase subunit RPC12/RpoP
MQLIKDLGQKDFGKYKKRIGLYECPICKNHFETRTESVKNGKSTKCKNCSSKTHGLRNHKIYNAYNAIKSRVFNLKNKYYKNYGGRGITICDEWKNDFMSFYNWSIENGYKEGLSIDRINNDGNYEPLNCRWTTRNIQQRNTRAIYGTNTSGYRGVSFYKKSNKFSSSIKVMGKRIYIGCFKTAEEAGYAYDKFVIENNLEHTSNGLFKG